MTRDQIIKAKKEEQFKKLPPNDYRRLSVVPTTAEIKETDKPFLRAMPENS
jgi:hypothetical protein